MTSAIQRISESARSVLIAVNPHSGASDKQEIARKLARLLQKGGFDVHIPASIQEICEKAGELHELGSLRAVVAAGGDGTAAMLVNELPFSFPLAILPLGTENLLAKHLQLTADPDLLCKLISDGYTARLDVGRANEKLFLVMCSCGFDADVVSRLHSVRKGHINHWSYAFPILNAIRRYGYPTLRITVNGVEQIESKWAFVFNVPRYAMNLPIVPEADCMDGKLDLCTFRGGHLLRGLFYLGGVLLRQHRQWKDTHFARVNEMTIEAPESGEPVAFQLDGDPGGELPVRISVVPGVSSGHRGGKLDIEIGFRHVE